MAEKQSEVSSNMAVTKEIYTFSDVLGVLVRYKRTILGVTVMTGVLASGIAFILPETFRSSTVLLPPQAAQSGAAALLSQLGGTAGAMANVAGLKNPNDLYIGILKSRTIADNLIKNFDLRAVYDTASLERAREYLQKSTNIAAGKDGLIVISVEDTDRARAAAVANGYVTELISRTANLAITEASQRRMFYEQQLNQAKENLFNAESMLKKGLDTHGVISVDVETRAAVETIAKIRANVSAKEIQLNSMRAFVTSNNPDYRRIEEELASLRAELARLENGRSARGDRASGSSAAGGLGNMKILRDVKYQQMLYELLAKQYEMARLEEARNPAIIQVLDTAIPAEKPIKPKRILMIALSMVLALVVTSGVMMLRERLANASR